MTPNTLNKPRRKKGRPTVFTSNAKRRLVRAIGAGVPMRMACASCRVSYSAFCEFRNANPKFEEKIQKAIADAIEWHLNNIVAAARNGSVENSRWFLERTQPAHFGRTKLEVTGADGEPLAGAQIAVLVWPHQNQNHQNEIITEKNHPAIPAPDAS
jgi:hypothetical protein